MVSLKYGKAHGPDRVLSMREQLACRRVPHEKARIPACGMGERIGLVPEKRKRQLGLEQNQPDLDA